LDVVYTLMLKRAIHTLWNVLDEDIITLNIPTGTPLIYELDKEQRSIKHYYLLLPCKIIQSL